MTYSGIDNGFYKFDFDKEECNDSLSVGEFQICIITGNVSGTHNGERFEDKFGAGDKNSATNNKHFRTILKIKTPVIPSENSNAKITNLYFKMKTGASGDDPNGDTAEIYAHPITLPATSIDMNHVAWENYGDGLTWGNRGGDFDDASDYGFGGNGRLISQKMTADETFYTFDLSNYINKVGLDWNTEYAFIFKSSALVDADVSADTYSGNPTLNDTNFTIFIYFTDELPKAPLITAAPKIGGRDALITVATGGEADLFDLFTCWRNDATAPTYSDNVNSVTDVNPGVLDTSKASHFDAGILSAEDSRYRVAVYARDQAASYVATAYGTTRSNIIELVRPKILSVVVNTSFNTIGVEGQLTVAATTGGAWSSYGAASLKYLHILWDGPATGATTNDDGVSKIEITDIDATTVTHTHTYSTDDVKYVWVALEDTNGFMSGMHRIDDNDNNTGGVDNNIATPAALPDVAESNPISIITTSKSKFLAAKYADYNTGLIVSASQSQAVGSNKKIQNYLFKAMAADSNTLVTVNAFDNDNNVFDDSSKRVALRALTDINVSAARLKVTGLASFASDGTPIIDTSSGFINYKMVSETIAPPDAVLVEGGVDGTASSGDAYNSGNYSYNFFKTVESAVFTTGDTDDTEGVRYILTTHTADWTVYNSGATTNEVDDGSEVVLNVTGGDYVFKAGDVIRLDNEFMKVTATDIANNRLQITRQYLGTAGNGGVATSQIIYLANPIVINSDLRWASAGTGYTGYHDRYRWGGFARILGEGATGIDFEPLATATETATNTIILQDIASASSSFNDTCWYENGFFDDDIIMVGNTTDNGTYAAPKYFKLASFTTGGSSNYETAIIYGSDIVESWLTSTVANEDNEAADIVRVISNPSRTVAAYNTNSLQDIIRFEGRVIDNDATSFLVKTNLDTTSVVMVQPEILDLNTVATYGARLTDADIAILRADISRDGGLATVMPLGERKYPVGLTRTTMGLPTMSVDIRVLSQLGYKSLLSLIEGDTYDYALMDSTQVDTPTSAYVTFRMKYVSGNLRKSPETTNDYLASLNFVIVGEAVTI